MKDFQASYEVTGLAPLLVAGRRGIVREVMLVEKCDTSYCGKLLMCDVGFSVDSATHCPSELHFGTCSAELLHT